MAERILVVDPDDPARAEMIATLSGAGYATSDAADTVAALAPLNAANVDLLITVVRPGVFNGWPLVLRGRTDNGRMAAIVVHDSLEDVAEADSMPGLGPVGAVVHVAGPIGNGELLRRVADALAGRERRRWTRMTLQAPLAIHTVSGRARVLDVSYGGVQLEFPSPTAAALPGRLHLELSSVGFLVDVRRVWNQARGGAMRCGTELQATTIKRALRWRRLVDSLRSAGASPPASAPEA